MGIITIKERRPQDDKHSGGKRTIYYSFAKSLFGNILMASTNQGLCSINFYEDEHQALYRLQQQFPHAILHPFRDDFQKNALAFFHHTTESTHSITLHISGTAFQLNVWQNLCTIPMGEFSTYAHIAKNIHNPLSFRAVGTAIGCNPIAFIIPCHRVIRSNGDIGGYKWGIEKKKTIIKWETKHSLNGI